MDEVSIEGSAGGGKITAKGDAASRITNQIADLLSPFSEVAGAMGDNLRIWRQSSVMQALDRAHTVARELDIELRPVAPKFLVNWVDKASLEDDDNLVEKWANLLLSGMGERSSTLIWSTNVLAELGRDEAIILDEMMMKGRKLIELEPYPTGIRHYRDWARRNVDEAHQIFHEQSSGVYDEADKKMFFAEYEKRDNCFVLFEKFEFRRTVDDADGVAPESLGEIVLHRSEHNLRVSDITIPIEHLLMKGLAERTTSDFSFDRTGDGWPGVTVLEGVSLTVSGAHFVKQVSLPR